ncbi:hypothetical protein E7744_14980 (plasmid) [Citricoccus sp. SGAir0253]|uniref:hypothetical protein n=1 Tax=Citricoccus sp. SGAir0253 TaxID=2567881 RepID=UPI0010CD01FD|nr:hypothetical protein [Citricoccus sp. SGAir0253]QCU79618.1 hypothetical protein E7744_14980 [Citricoccus sp. SGAir0253]
MAVADATGAVLNQYGSHRRTNAAAPATPWAVYLAGTDHRYRLLAFDLDAKNPGTAALAARDAETIAGLLRDAGLSALVCASGPSGGRHVWTAVADSVEADTVATLARLTRHLCPTLDLAPLTNPATGCVRPPGTPHRAGGASAVLAGDLDSLLNPPGTAGHVRGLVEHLATLVGASEPVGPLEAHRPVPLDDHGHPYLPGPRRELPAPSRAALAEDASAGDASAVLWRVLIGAAFARWKHADIAALVETSPGLEHLRTYRHSTGTTTHRARRTPQDAAATLARQWAKAVTHVATSPRQIGEDPTFDARADAIAAHVRDLQGRADAAAGRWTHGRGPADRRILDVLCLLALQALTPELEADTRRLALLAGLGRETARTALLRLAADGWITQTKAAEGPHGAHWSIHPHRDIHSQDLIGRSQADPRPAGAGVAERLTLLATLTERTRACAHDVFTLGPGLGHLAGNLYARTTTEFLSLGDLTAAIGGTLAHTARILDRLTSAGLLIHSPTGWRRHTTDHRHSAAKRLEVDGRLAERAARYRVERELWAWWQAEQAWMTAPRRTAASRRAGPGQLTLTPELGTNAYGAHPRRADGKADYRQARRLLSTGRALTGRRRPERSAAAA